MTFIFFALIPLIFVFLPYRKEVFVIPVILFEILLLAYFIPSSLSGALTQLFSAIELPEGYFVIFLCFILPVVYFYFTLNRKEKISQLFLLHFLFASVYVFLWSISSF